MEGKLFGSAEQAILKDIMINRRDIRGNRFIDKQIDEDVLQQILTAALHAPSVGFSQPWEFVIIRNDDTKQAVLDSFNEENDKAAANFEGERGGQYKKLKLEGVVESPVNIAVFYTPSEEPVLGQTSMKEMGLYSVVCAVQNMWLMARSLNVGMGWLSIIDPEKVKQVLHAPENYKLIAYLCMGYTNSFPARPELETLEWNTRKQMQQVVKYESCNNTMHD